MKEYHTRVSWIQSYSELINPSDNNGLWIFGKMVHKFPTSAKFSYGFLFGTLQGLLEELNKQVLNRKDLQCSIHTQNKIVVHAQIDGGITIYTFSAYSPN